jgi:serine/threonine protein kinase
MELLSIGLQIAEALSAAHQQGLVHRDIKPANILLDEGGHRVLLSDFGLARALDDASVTASGMVAGTPNYMSPEQARGETIDARSDLYSLGAVLYTMATGHPPARGDSPLAVLRKVTDDHPRMIHAVNETMPAWLDTLIGRFIEKRRERRLASAEEAVHLLRGCLAHLRAPARIDLPAEIAPRPSLGRIASLVAVALLTSVSGFATAQMSSTNPSPTSTSPSPTSTTPSVPSTSLTPVTRFSPLIEFEPDPLDDQLRSLTHSLQDLQRKLDLP